MAVSIRRPKRYGNDYVPSWCHLSLFVDENGNGDEDVCCAYCGERASSSDHVIPFSWLHSLVGEVDRSIYWTWIVPACQECNSTASSLMFPTPAAKRRYIQQRLEARYDFAFAGQRWTDHEIEELGPGLRQYVTAMQSKAENVRRRVTWCGPLPNNVGSPRLVQVAASFRAKKNATRNVDLSRSGRHG